MNFREFREKAINEQSRELSDSIKNPLLCDLLALRGINDKNEAQAFLNPKEQIISSPDVFCDVEKAAARIFDAIKNNEKILVWGDFDADGVTSSALLYKTFKALDANFENFIPNREEHGHGLNSKEALKLVAKHKVKVLITVDCGISDTKEVNLLKGLGVDVIITDHHKADGEIPDAYAILNPQAPDSLKDDLSVAQIRDLSRLAGVGVAYKLALRLLGEDEKYNDVKDQLLVLAAVGTISDVVPILGENRTIVAKGLELIAQNKHKGISMLFKNNGREKITSTDIAFVLTPRINAVGRLSTPDLAFDFLTQENESSLNFILEKLDNFNKIRQSLCENIFLEARDMVLADKNYEKEPAIVLYKEDWHLGIIGIVASKLVEEFLKPVFMVTNGPDNMGRSSIRSIGGYNVYQILKKNSDLFVKFGGHSLAGGFYFDMKEHTFDEVKEGILAAFEEYSDVEPASKYFEVDKFLCASQINKELLETVETLEPFGQDNPSPVFAIKDALLINSRLMGKNSNHLKFNCQKDNIEFECVKWNEGELKIPQNSKIDVAFSARLNLYNGQETIQLNVYDVFSETYAKKAKNGGLKIYDHRKKTGILTQIADYLKRDGLDIAIWAKKAKTVKCLSEFPEIQKNIYSDLKKHDGIMFFDYPCSYEELKNALSNIKPTKIHIMNDTIEENIENLVKSVSGMLKYSHNQKDGTIDIEKMAQAIGVSESFIQIALEIFESTGCIEILDVDKIKYNEAVSFENFSKNSMFEILNEEYEKITEFKKHLANDEIDKMQELLFSEI